jgi:hypothetical protein
MTNGNRIVVNLTAGSSGIGIFHSSKFRLDRFVRLYSSRRVHDYEHL